MNETLTPEVVTLKNSTEEAEAAVVTVFRALRHLMQDAPIVFYELVQLCRNPAHRLFGSAGETLRARSLLETDGTVHESIRNIVLSATAGDGLSLHLVNPRKDT